jgi:hypothetical protein
MIYVDQDSSALPLVVIVLIILCVFFDAMHRECCGGLKAQHHRTKHPHAIAQLCVQKAPCAADHHDEKWQLSPPNSTL